MYDVSVGTTVGCMLAFSTSLSLVFSHCKSKLLHVMHLYLSLGLYEKEAVQWYKELRMIK